MNRQQENDDKVEDSFQRLMNRIEAEGVRSAPSLRERRMRWRLLLSGTTMIILAFLWVIERFL